MFLYKDAYNYVLLLLKFLIPLFSACMNINFLFYVHLIFVEDIFIILGRRHNRGTHRQLNARELVSLSPDPVEQVRQMEEDERMARMLQVNKITNK